MNFLKSNKLIVASLAALVLLFSASICASAAQIDELSVVDSTIYASVSGEDATLFAAEYNEGLLVDVFFKDTSNGYVELKVGASDEYKLFLWDRESLAPVSCVYNLIDNKAYASGSDIPLPEYSFQPYTFDQEDNIMIVSRIDTASVIGYKAGVETTYSLADSVYVMGLSDSIADVVPGSVVLLGMDKNGNCSAIELLASLGFPINPEAFEADFGAYAPSDGSSKYLNVITELAAKPLSGIQATTFPAEKPWTTILFENTKIANCYRIGIALDGDTPIISCTANKITAYPSIFSSTVDFHNYLYFRYNTETGKIKELAFYCVPQDLNIKDDEYSPIFGLGPIEIIQ